MGDFKGRDILAMGKFSKEEILHLLEVAKKMKRAPPGRILEGKLMASCFFEPSTRTRLSFESAMKRLGGDVIGFSEPSATSAKKGESLSDAMRVIGSYADILVIRHPVEGSAFEAAEATSTPVINAGDGANEHPTQTFLDLFTIEECQGKLEGLNIILAGDLKYSRTIHSLAQALKCFGAKLFFVSPPSLPLPDKVIACLRDGGVPFSFHHTLEEVVAQGDILYMTRVQKERFNDLTEYENVKNTFNVTPELLAKGKKSLKVLSPLPRLEEIDTRVDATEHAYYFEQAANGVFVRQALLTLVLGLSP